MSAGFAATCGASTASAAVTGRVPLPGLKKFGDGCGWFVRVDLINVALLLIPETMIPP